MSKISELSDGGSLVSSDYLIAVRSGGNVKVRMDQINVDQVDLGDNEFIRLGNSQDLTMVHTSTQSIINQAGIGDLLLQKAGATKLTINATGIDVTGSVTADGATFSGAVDITANVDDQLTLSRAAGNNRIIKYETAGVSRWAVYADGVAEAGSDAGSDYQISYYNDAGVYQGNALTLTRATGAATFSGTVTADGLTSSGDVTLGNGASLQIDDQDSLLFGTFALGSSGTLLQGGTSIAFDTYVGGKKRHTIDSNGDLSLYEDTGTTPKFFWDASAESLSVPTLSITDGSITTTAAAGDHTVFNSTGADADFRVRTAANTHSVYVQGNTGNVGIGTLSPASPTGFGTGGILHLKGSTGNDCSIVLEGLTGSGGRQEIGASGGALQFYRGAATGSMSESMRIDASGHAIIPAGVTLGTAVGTYNAANTLDDYEEGTWTPAQGSGLTVSGAFSSSGTYTKIGRMVYVKGFVGGATSVSCSQNGQICTGLPFAANIGGENAGISMDDGRTASRACSALSNSTVQNTSAIPSNPYGISFAITYQTS